MGRHHNGNGARHGGWGQNGHANPGGKAFESREAQGQSKAAYGGNHGNSGYNDNGGYHANGNAGYNQHYRHDRYKIQNYPHQHEGYCGGNNDFISNCNFNYHNENTNTQSLGMTPASPSNRRLPEQCPPADCLNMIVKYLLAEDVESAERWLDIMARECKGTSNKAFYHSLIHACARAGNPNAAGWCAVRMVRVGLQPNKVTFNSVIDACAKVGDIDLASKWWEQMMQIGLKPNGITYNTMINACAQAKDAAHAEWWMQQMLKDSITPCTVSFSTVIDAFAKTGKVEKAEAWFHQMNEAGVQADAVIYNSLINACAKAGSPSKAESWLYQMQLNSLEPDEKTYNSLINACAKAGVTDRAEHWFKMMEMAGCKVDKITFGSVIHASAKVGNVARAEYWMDEMRRRGVVPNLVCFNTVLHACAHNGDYMRASKWFQEILSSNNRPNKITYNSMIDAYAKAGDVKSAEMWLQQMVAKGFHPDQISYVTLLRACTHLSPDSCEQDPDEHSRWTYGAIIKAYAHTGSLTGMKRWLSEMTRGFKPSRALADEVHLICCQNNKKILGDQVFALMKRHFEAMDSSPSGQSRPARRNDHRVTSAGQVSKRGGGQQLAGLPLVDLKQVGEMQSSLPLSGRLDDTLANDSRAVASEDISLEGIRGELHKLTEEEDDGRDLEPLEPLEPPEPLELTEPFEQKSPCGSAGADP